MSLSVYSSSLYDSIDIDIWYAGSDMVLLWFIVDLFSLIHIYIHLDMEGSLSKGSVFSQAE